MAERDREVVGRTFVLSPHDVDFWSGFPPKCAEWEPTMQYAFDDYRLDPALRELRCGGSVVHAEPQVFDLVLHLLQNRERVVSLDELVDKVWEGRHISESTIRNRINAARKLLGDDGSQQRLIRTIARKGIRFVGAAVEESKVRGGGGADSAPARAANGPAETLVPDKPEAETGRPPVVGVLPFANLSGDPDQDHLGDGFTEDIITMLARHRSLFVIARNSAFAFKDHASDVRHVGRQLGAEYVVEGSVRRVRDDLRVTAHLIETATGQLLWADRFDRRMEALFEVQDEITNMIVASIEPQIGSAERARLERRTPSSLHAWDLFRLGTKHLYKATRRDNLEAQRVLGLAIEHDRELAQAYAHLSYAVLLSMLYFDADPEEQRLTGALDLARRALELDDQDAMTRFVYGRVLLARRAYGEALDELEQAVALNPALAIGYCGVGDSLAYEGRYDEAFPFFQRAIELSPHDPQRWAFLAYRALAHLFARQFRRAADWAQKATRVPNCHHYWPYAHRVAALGHLECPDDLEATVNELLQRNPRFSCRNARRRLFYIKKPDQLKVYIDGLRKAGIPEGSEVG
jgi:TolB-like protein/Tfp pilus assembly protein PilF